MNQSGQAGTIGSGMFASWIWIIVFGYFMIREALLICFFCLGAVVAVPCRASSSSACRSVEEDVNTILSSWKERDWKHMYLFVSSKNKDENGYMSFKNIREKMQKISKLAGYRTVNTERTSALRAVAQVKLYMLYNPQANYTFTDKWQKETVDVKWKLVCEGGGWKIVLPQ